MSRSRQSPVADAPITPGADERLIDRFGLLLGVTSASVVVQMLVNVDPTQLGVLGSGAVAGSLALTLLTGATMVLALRTAGIRRRRRRGFEAVVGVLVVLLSVMLLATIMADEPVMATQASSPPYFWLLLSAVAPFVVVRRLLQHQTVSVQTLYGALAAYLLLGITFGFAFQTVDALQTTPFFGTAEPTTSYLYYSFVTITTTGYGNLTAATELGQLLSVVEAVVGQVYLVTVVAMIVGLLAQRRAG